MTLLMSAKERDHWINYLVEASTYTGLGANLYQLQSSVSDLNNDEVNTYKEPVKVHLFFEDNPTPVLKSYNWLTEDENNPYIVYLTYKNSEMNDMKIESGCMLDIPSYMHEEGSSKYIISKVRGNSINPLYWICKITPHREKIVQLKQDNINITGYNYLKR